MKNLLKKYIRLWLAFGICLTAQAHLAIIGIIAYFLGLPLCAVICIAILVTMHLKHPIMKLSTWVVVKIIGWAEYSEKTKP